MLIGFNPARCGPDPTPSDGAWETPEKALLAFAAQFIELCKDLKGKTLYVRKSPALEPVYLFDADAPMYRCIGRFEVLE